MRWVLGPDPADPLVDQDFRHLSSLALDLIVASNVPLLRPRKKDHARNTQEALF
jgi:hypothetical protein